MYILTIPRLYYAPEYIEELLNEQFNIWFYVVLPRSGKDYKGV
jgi:hypothetical protein